MARADERIPEKEVVENLFRKVEKKHDIIRALLVTLGILITVFITAAITAVLFIQVFRVDGGSMADTLQGEDLVVVIDAVSIGAGDIIACRYGDDILVKRIIATGGDLVDIQEDGTVLVNGSPLEEPYLTEKALGKCDITLPCQVPEGHNFVMGDHRTVSVDSRSAVIGCIEDSHIIGKVIFRIWPLKTLGPVR